MCRKKSVWEIFKEFRTADTSLNCDEAELSEIGSAADGSTLHMKVREEFEKNIELFFSRRSVFKEHNQGFDSEATCATVTEDTAATERESEIPPHWRAVYAIADIDRDVIVTTFDTRVPGTF